VFEAWNKYLCSIETKKGFCVVSGNTDVAIAQKHPAKIRNAKDGAKLISSNDGDGYTFRGRFIDAEQTISVSSEVTQKAHSALRWLVGREQAYKNDSQVFVSWETFGIDIPSICAGTDDLLKDAPVSDYQGDVGQEFAKRLKAKIAGYTKNISDNNCIVVMGLDSAVPGRLAITFYRELNGSEFFDRIETWHTNFAWFQNYGKDPKTKAKIIFVGAPSPRDIAMAAYGRKVEGQTGKKLMNATVERILPCIVDGVKFPRDLLQSAVNRVNNRAGLATWAWEKALGIACALYKGTHQGENYKMSLEEERTTRDYLYGRLWAVADCVELTALRIAGEKRETNAARLMSRFADRPFSTWKTIELGLHRSYFARIAGKYPGLSAGYQELLDTIHALFNGTDYVDDTLRLSGEYLLGYHCQRRWLQEHSWQHGKWAAREKSSAGQDDENDDEEAGNGNAE
jgi:CRISPR-associated protein Csd1